ncbi:MAG: O-methyltransferase [Candidatus Cloacimonetes bacterium]|mgnify:FL=1|jgi:predicted O-methyltransferase YrrM|nr:O-methyltransferase [Candidatus Cloacimonadota bacterium]MBT7469436.1 O-methyltransferase [Candidatus Cloacimonadota bacterium]
MKKIKNLFVTELTKFAQQKTEIHRLWNIDEQTANLLYMLIKAKRPTNILEIGTSNGYSTFWLSISAEKAKIHTIEVDEERFHLAKENLQNRDNITQHFGKAEEIISTLTQKFDFIFIDAGKIGYINYIKLIIDKLENGAIIVADNVISHKNSVQDYLDFIKNNENFETATIEIGDGLEISIFQK